MQKRDVHAIITITTVDAIITITIVDTVNPVVEAIPTSIITITVTVVMTAMTLKEADLVVVALMLNPHAKIGPALPLRTTEAYLPYRQ